MLILKNIYKVAVSTALAVSVLGMASCNDMLDIAPSGQFGDDQLNDNSLDGLMASAYAGLEAHFFGNNEAFSGPSTNWVFDVRSDDAYKGGGGVSMEANIHQLEISNLTSDNVTNLNKWRNNYYAIARVHQAMRAINEAENLAEYRFDVSDMVNMLEIRGIRVDHPSVRRILAENWQLRPAPPTYYQRYTITYNGETQRQDSKTARVYTVTREQLGGLLDDAAM